MPASTARPASSPALPKRSAGTDRWRRTILVVAAALLAFALLDVALRLAPRETVGPRLANYVFSRYRQSPGGIYAREPLTGLRFMWPGADTENYWNRYQWRHRTDARGFRNPEGAATDVLLLGDSLVYGHGVEEENTFAARLREQGIGTYNLGRQGDCLYDEYVLARLYLAELRPRLVVLFPFLNDYADLESYRDAEQIADPPELSRYDYREIARSRDAVLAAPPGDLAIALASAPAIRLVAGLGRSLANAEWMRRAHAAAEAAPAAAPAEDPLLEPFSDPVRRERLDEYHRRVLADLAHRLDAAGVELVLAPLPPGAEPSHLAESQAHLRQLLLEISIRHGATYLDLTPALAGCGECFLPGDGHLSPIGHARVAAALLPALRSTF